MEFDWDNENRQHISQHNVTTDEAEQAFLNDPVDLEVQEDADDIFRYKQIGETNAGRILLLLTTDRGNMIRFATAYDAPPILKTLYHRIKARESWKSQ